MQNKYGIRMCSTKKKHYYQSKLSWYISNQCVSSQILRTSLNAFFTSVWNSLTAFLPACTKERAAWHFSRSLYAANNAVQRQICKKIVKPEMLNFMNLLKWHNINPVREMVIVNPFPVREMDFCQIEYKKRSSF